MKNILTGLHHITAIASDPQRNVDFYGGLLGLRLVKKTVNFDDPTAYHIYYGDETGAPGSIVTFFYWPGMEARGRVGVGQTTAIVFSAPSGSLDYWTERLKKNNVTVVRQKRFGEEVLSLNDPDNIPIELVAVEQDDRKGWTSAGVPAEHALRGLHTAELTVRQAKPTEALLTGAMNFRLVRREGTRARFEAGSGGSGHYADVVESPNGSSGSGGTGTIHHIAWSIPDGGQQLDKREELRAAGFLVSPVMDRDYFHSIYYRERGGILFEVATAEPGFAVDEPAESLGTALKLPRQVEPARAQIEQVLPTLAAPKRY